VILVGIVIAWPGSVTYWLGGHKTLDPSAVEQKLQQLQFPAAEPGRPPSFDLGPLKIQ
jgi:hypothetical protein